MKIEIPKVLREIPLSEYHADFGAQKVMVWVNPPLSMGKRRSELMSRSLRLIGRTEQGVGTTPLPEAEREAEELNLALWAWYAEIWSQGADVETHWTFEEVLKAYEDCPDLVRWLIERTNALFLQQREQEKKA